MKPFNIQKMSNIPNNRAEFEKNIHIFRELMMNDKVQFAQGLKSIDDILKVKKLPNKRVDFLSVGDLARATINSFVNFQNLK
jgi:hypothetical protein